MSFQLGSPPPSPGIMHKEEQVTAVLYERAIKANEVFYCGITARLDQKWKQPVLRSLRVCLSHLLSEKLSLLLCRHLFNLLKPNDIYVYIYICLTAALTSRRYILNIYSTNIHTEYFKYAA